MAHSLSARKRGRQNIRRRTLNRARRAVLRKRLRTCREALADDNVETAEKTYRLACKALDREANRGTLHRNAAARRKSRLARRLNAMRSGPAD